MTIQKVINKVQEENPNSFQTEKLIEFINEIETEVAHELEENFTPYTDVKDEDDNDIVLMAPDPYSRLYVSYLKAMIDYVNREYTSYQLNAEQHGQDFSDFRNWIVRENVAVNHIVPSRFRNIW